MHNRKHKVDQNWDQFEMDEEDVIKASYFKKRDRHRPSHHHGHHRPYESPTPDFLQSIYTDSSSEFQKR